MKSGIDGERLKSVRLARGKKAGDMAQLLEIEERTYRNYENGTRDVGTAALIKICQYLDVSPSYLLGMSDEENAGKNNIVKHTTKLQKRYDALDDHAKELINTIVDKEYNRCKNTPTGTITTTRRNRRTGHIVRIRSGIDDIPRIMKEPPLRESAKIIRGPRATKNEGNKTTKR